MALLGPSLTGGGARVKGLLFKLQRSSHNTQFTISERRHLLPHRASHLRRSSGTRGFL